MEVRYSIWLHPTVTARDIPKLDAFWRRTIHDDIRSKLTKDPELYGKPLRHTLKGCWSLRVGDYRVVYQVDKEVVQVIAVIHRSRGYEGVITRL